MKNFTNFINQKIKMSFRFGVVAFGIVSVFASLVASQVYAQQSTLTQEILDTDCTHTNYETAVGQMNDPICALFAPALDHYELSGNIGAQLPILYGVYDAVHAYTNPVTGKHDLKVTINGRTYVLGIDPELTVDGNAWKLDLSNWNNDHPDDKLVFAPDRNYVGEVTSVLNDTETGGNVTVTQSGNFVISIPADETGGNPPWEPWFPNTGFLSKIGHSWGAFILICIVTVEILGCVTYLIIKKRRRR